MLKCYFRIEMASDEDELVSTQELKSDLLDLVENHQYIFISKSVKGIC